jgi:hypothetical protein
MLAHYQRASAPGYQLVSFLILRSLGLVFLAAFLSLFCQVLPLIGSEGLLPADRFLERVESHFGGKWQAFQKVPTAFYLGISDRALWLWALVGVIGSALLLLGVSNAFLILFLWGLYFSFISIGQLFYGYGWESQLLETSLLAMFLCPARGIRPFPKNHRPPLIIIWLHRWLAFRIMLGAGLIKIRGADCWRDLTALHYHFETQPIPNPLSWHLHHLPDWMLSGGVVANHVVELAVPFLIFWPRRARLAAAILLVGFQVTLILSGNLSFLNYLTIVPCLACLDDRFVRRMIPRRLHRYLPAPGEEDSPAAPAPSRPRIRSRIRSRHVLVGLYTAMVCWLSIAPTRNLLSSRQAMNTSFEPFRLVNTYGAFGSIGKERNEIVLEGTSDDLLFSLTKWKAYGWLGKPGRVDELPPIIAPYQPRIDWQIWFAAMQRPEQNAWLLHLIDKLLRNDPGALSLLADNPFPEKPPKHIRCSFYRYRFTTPEERKKTGNWWVRERRGNYLPPFHLQHEGLRKFLHAHGFTHTLQKPSP